MSTEEIPFQEYKNSTVAKSVGTLGVALLVIGICLGLLSLWSDTARFWHNYLIMYMFLVSIAVGSLFYVALEYIIGANWSTPFRRVFECLASMIPWIFVLAIPILLLGMPKLYHHWLPVHHHAEASASHSSQTHAKDASHSSQKGDHGAKGDHGGAHGVDPIIEGKRGYLNKPFFWLRCILCFVIWYGFYFWFTRNSMKQDETGDQKLTGYNIKLAAAFMLIFPITLTMAAVDFMMSLEPHWFSTMFGVYYFAGTLVSSMAVITIIAVKLRESGYLHPKLKRDSYYSLGLLMFAFNTFWAYIAFSQFMLIWYGNLPEETMWFAHRYGDGWTVVVWFLIIFHFVIPFFALLSRTQKTNPARLLFMAKWLILAHVLDLYFIVMPAKGEGGYFHWMDIGFFIFAVGVVMVLFNQRAQKVSLVPWKDPKLNLGLGFRMHDQVSE